MEYYLSTLTLPALKLRLQELVPDVKPAKMKKQEIIDTLLGTPNQNDLSWVDTEPEERLQEFARKEEIRCTGKSTSDLKKEVKAYLQSPPIAQQEELLRENNLKDLTAKCRAQKLPGSPHKLVMAKKLYNKENVCVNSPQKSKPRTHSFAFLSRPQLLKICQDLSLNAKGTKVQLEKQIQEAWETRGQIHWGMEDEDATCKICYDADVNMIIMPCRHSLCGPCSLTIVSSRRRTCPFCNQNMLRIWPTSFDLAPPKAKDLEKSAKESVALSLSAGTTPKKTPSSLSLSSPSCLTTTTTSTTNTIEEDEASSEQPTTPLTPSRLNQAGFHFEPPNSSSSLLPEQFSSPLLVDPFPLPTTTTSTTTTTTTNTTLQATEGPVLWELQDGEFFSVSFRAPGRGRRARAPLSTRTAFTSLLEETKIETETSVLADALADLLLDAKS